MNGMHPSTQREYKPEINSVDAVPLPHYGLTSLQVVCALEASKGRKASDIQKQFNVSKDTWRRWNQNPRFAEHVTALLQDRKAIVEGVLRDGELEASATLVGALRATTPIRHKDGKIREHPAWEVRTRAAISLLDRAGERGKPVERVAQHNMNWNTPEVRSELSQALADPLVREFLAQDPEFAARLRKELAQLPAPSEEPCDSTSPTSSSPSPAPDSTPSPGSAGAISSPPSATIEPETPPTSPTPASSPAGDSDASTRATTETPAE